MSMLNLYQQFAQGLEPNPGGDLARSISLLSVSL